jgi:hypothetical protein
VVALVPEVGVTVELPVVAEVSPSLVSIGSPVEQATSGRAARRRDGHRRETNFIAAIQYRRGQGRTRE